MPSALRRLMIALPLCLSAAAAWAADSAKLIPLLLDIPGWAAEQADYMSMDSGGFKMLTVTRSYTKGEDKRFTATVMVGNAGAVQGVAAAGTVKMETRDQKMIADTVDGFYLIHHHMPADKNGTINIVLGDAAMLMMEYGGLSDAEAMTLAKAFRWKELSAAVR